MVTNLIGGGYMIERTHEFSDEEIAKLVLSKETEQIARIIYNEIYLPGTEDSEGWIMPPFEEAQSEEYGGYLRAVRAALSVVYQTQQQVPL